MANQTWAVCAVMVVGQDQRRLGQVPELHGAVPAALARVRPSGAKATPTIGPDGPVNFSRRCWLSESNTSTDPSFVPAATRLPSAENATLRTSSPRP